MNLVLIEPDETGRPLPREDRRARHIIEVLRRKVGESFDAGVVNGPRGKAVVAGIDASSLTLAYTWDAPVPAPEPITLVVGITRPQTARDILRDATTLGVGALHFVQAERSDANYAQSSLWTSGEWRRHVLAGAEQAFSTRIPEVHTGRTLAATLAALEGDATRVGLDNYEATATLGALNFPAATGAILALGGERGWSTGERQALRAHRFTLASLGSRVLRTETAVVAALALTRARIGLA